MTARPNILVVCARNKKRSRTAEYIFKNDSRFNIRSAGLSAKSEKQLSEKDLIWADLIFVMEPGHRARITGTYRQLLLPEIVVMDIPDEYEFLDEELILALKDRINNTLRVLYKL